MPTKDEQEQLSTLFVELTALIGAYQAENPGTHILGAVMFQTPGMGDHAMIAYLGDMDDVTKVAAADAFHKQ